VSRRRGSTKHSIFDRLPVNVRSGGEGRRRRNLILVKAQAGSLTDSGQNTGPELLSMSANLSTSFFIAKLLGPTFAIIGLSVLLRERAFKAILKDAVQSPALLYFSGFLSFVSGLALILTHNIWSLDWRLLITLIGWIAAVRGFVTIFQPQWASALFATFMERQSIFYSAAAVNVLLGFVLIYLGYFP